MKRREGLGSLKGAAQLRSKERASRICAVQDLAAGVQLRSGELPKGSEN